MPGFSTGKARASVEARVRTKRETRTTVQRREPRSAITPATRRPARKRAPVTGSRKGSSVTVLIQAWSPRKWKARAMRPRFPAKRAAGVPGSAPLAASRPRHRPIPEVPGALQHVLEERQEHEEGGRRDEEPVTNEAAAVVLPARIEEREAEGDRDHRGNDLERVVAVLPEPQPEAGRERARAVAAAHVAQERGEKEGRGEHRPRERQARGGRPGSATCSRRRGPPRRGRAARRRARGP